MKTSVIVSTFAALCLLITFAEAPTRRNAESNNSTSAIHFSYFPANRVTAKPTVMVSASTIKKAAIQAEETASEDFSYLEFNVSDFIDKDETASEINTENSFDYLKFDVNEYTNSEANSYEAIELPVNEFEYLKFDVNEYTATGKADIVESIELPVNEFESLKFDVTKYSTTNEAYSYETIELPANEFDYLKFDVTKYASHPVSDNLGELPVNE